MPILDDFSLDDFELVWTSGATYEGEEVAVELRKERHSLIFGLDQRECYRAIARFPEDPDIQAARRTGHWPLLEEDPNRAVEGALEELIEKKT